MAQSVGFWGLFWFKSKAGPSNLVFCLAPCAGQLHCQGVVQPLKTYLVSSLGVFWFVGEAIHGGTQEALHWSVQALQGFSETEQVLRLYAGVMAGELLSQGT